MRNRFAISLRTLLLTLTLSVFAGGVALASGEIMVLSAPYQETPWNLPATWTVQWASYATFVQDFTMTFGDGQTSTYRCWSNCSSGNTSWNHQFGSVGYFDQVVTAIVQSNYTTTRVY